MTRYVRTTRWLILAMLLLGWLVSPAAALGVDGLLSELQLTPHKGLAPRPFTLPTLDGRSVSLAAYKGKVVLLYFWATW